MKGIRIIIILVWGCLVVVGMGKVWDYEKTPVVETRASVQWPEGMVLPAEGVLTLVAFIHPHCPCTRATLSELEQVMKQCQGKIETRLFFIQPAGFSEDWSKTPLWSTAQKIPGVRVFLDPAGETARRFQATASGECMLYDSSGKLLFHGGITGSRGHVGNNAGRSSVVAIANHLKPTHLKTFVYGCALFNSVGMK